MLSCLLNLAACLFLFCRLAHALLAAVPSTDRYILFVLDARSCQSTRCATTTTSGRSASSSTCRRRTAKGRSWVRTHCHSAVWRAGKAYRFVPCAVWLGCFVLLTADSPSGSCASLSARIDLAAFDMTRSSLIDRGGLFVCDLQARWRPRCRRFSTSTETRRVLLCGLMSARWCLRCSSALASAWYRLPLCSHRGCSSAVVAACAQQETLTLVDDNKKTGGGLSFGRVDFSLPTTKAVTLTKNERLFREPTRASFRA